MQLALSKFDPRTIGNNRICIIVAKRGSGKSFLARDLMYWKRHIPFGICMSGTEESNGQYARVVPDVFVYSEYNSDILGKIIKRQKKLCKQGTPNNGVFVIIDDLMYDKKMMKDPIMRALFMNGRHWNMFTIITMQYCMDMSPDLRTNVDYVFALREPIIQNRERLYKSYFGIFPTFDMFNQVMDQCTENFECLVLDNTSRSNKLQDCVYFYKARDVPDFKMGSKEFWQVHRSVYNPKYDDSDEDDTYAKPAKKRGSMVVTVKKNHVLK